MSASKIFELIIANKDYVPLYSAMIATFAFLFSIFSFVIANVVSLIRSKKDKECSDKRYEEQRKQYEERLSEEKRRREEDKREANEKNRVSEEPYLVFKESKVVGCKYADQMIINFVFINKGRGSAYEIVPDVDCSVRTIDNKDIKIYRNGPVEDPIATVGEKFEVKWSYISKEKYNFRMNPTITFKDASGRKYKQTYEVDIVDENGNANIINYAKPQLLEQ